MASAKIIFASDLAPIRAFAPLMKADPKAIYGDLLPLLEAGDYNIVNLESPLYSGGDFIVKSGAAFSGDPEHVTVLMAGHFQAAVCANNHAFDRGDAGFFRTRETLRANAIACVGAGGNLREARKPLVFTLNGLRIALFAISEGEDMRGATPTSPGVRPWEVEELARELRRARKRYDVLLVSAHCGLEYQPFPSYYVYEAFRLWAEAGADLIIGHHPHVPQGRADFGGVPAYFSLGNFAFYQPLPLFYRKTGYLLEIELGDRGIRSHRPVPYRIHDRGLRLLSGREKRAFDQLFKSLSAPLATAEGARRAWHAVLAYNGVGGFRAELAKILAKLDERPPAGAAMLRNRVCCMQHRTQWIDGLSRIADGTIADAPADLVKRVADYMTREVEA